MQSESGSVRERIQKQGAGETTHVPAFIVDSDPNMLTAHLSMSNYMMAASTNRVTILYVLPSSAEVRSLPNPPMSTRFYLQDVCQRPFALSKRCPTLIPPVRPSRFVGQHSHSVLRVGKRAFHTERMILKQKLERSSCRSANDGITPYLRLGFILLSICFDVE